MNEHLNQVFSGILSELEKNNIKYWVYGGTAIAGINGNFFRYNKDIDAYVLEKDYKKAENIVISLSVEYGLIPNITFLQNHNRPKIEVFKDAEAFRKNDDMFSLIPAYEIGDGIEFIFPNSEGKFDGDILNLIQRKLNGYNFYTPQNKYIKELFYNHIKVLGGWDKLERVRKDLYEKYKKDHNFLLEII